MSHKCRARGCEKVVPDHILMCFPHWRKVPKDLQVRVYREWRKVERSDDQVLTREYIAAIDAAIASVPPVDPSPPRLPL